MKRHLGYGNAQHASTYTVDGVTDTLTGWAARLGTSYICLYKRIVLRQMNPSDAIRQGAKNMGHKEITANGETHTIAEWGRITGVDQDIISQRLLYGTWTVEEAVGLKPHQSFNEDMLTWRGKTLSHTNWAKRLGLNVDLFDARVRMWRAGRIFKKDVFRSTVGFAGRHKTSLMHYFKGKRYSTFELAKKKGVSHSWFYSKMKEGHSIYNIMTKIEKPTNEEIAALAAASYKRNKRIRELKKMGIII